jgi:hypothetical protein
VLRKEVETIVKIAPYIVLCLVLLSIFYCCTVASVSCSTSNIPIAWHSQNANFGISANALRYKPLGDPIDSPKPN